VSRYVEEWTRLSDRIGFWADMENPYVTYHNDYIETCWWILKQLWDHGMVYQDYRSTPHCPRCGTSLSDHEVALGYEDDTPDPSVFVKFRVPSAEFRERVPAAVAGEPVSIVAWTTTPWTLPGNTALAVKENADYGLYEHDGEYYVVAAALAEKVMGGQASLVAGFKGGQLVGLPYEPLYRPEICRSG
jgi:isoleucyl-tRNA synthetase